MSGFADRLRHAAAWRLRRWSGPLRPLVGALLALPARRRLARLAREHEALLARLRGEAAARQPGGEPLRVLAIGAWTFPAYSQSFVYQELAALVESGLDVRLAHTSCGPPAALPPACAALDGRTVRLPGERAITTRALARLRAERPEATARLLDLLAATSGRPERELVADEHLLRAFAFAGLAEAWGADAVHSCFFYEGSLAAFVAQQLLGVRRSVTCYTDHLLADYRLKLVAPQLAAADLVVATSERARRELVAIAPPCATRVLVKVNAVDTRFFAAVERAEPAAGEPFRLLTVARVDPKKGLSDLLAAAGALRDRGVPFLLEHLGGVESGTAGGEAEAERLRAETVRRGLESQVRWRGFVAAEEVRAALSRAHLFVAPSVETPSGDKDGLPTAVLEAMATGLPVVATRAGAIPEAIEDGIDGRLVAPGEPSALASAIAELLADPGRRRAMGAAAAESARARFSVERCEPALAARLREVVAAGRRPTPPPLPRPAEPRRPAHGSTVGPVPEAHHADPYPYFDELRASSPVHLVERGLWMLTRHEDVAAALRDPRLRRAATRAWRPEGRDWLGQLAERAATAEGRVETLGLARLWLINLDAPEHPPLRHLVGRELGPAAMEALRPVVAELCAELLDAVEGQTSFDLMDRFALQLPARVACDLLGVPPGDRDWTIARSRAVADALAGGTDAAAVARGSTATLELATYFSELLRSGRIGPRSHLLRYRDAGEAEPVTVAQALMFLFAGSETTANWIGNAMLALLGERERFAGFLLRPDDPPGRLAVALEELLRFDSPVQLTYRSCGERLTIGGRTIEAGERLALALAAANRDPDRFVEPGRIDLSRSPNPHLAFGGGVHTCLGAALARLEAFEACRALLGRCPEMALDREPPRRRAGALLRGLESLPVRPGAMARRPAGR